MKKVPNSKSNLERAISHYVGNDSVRANELAVALSNAIVAQMIDAGVVKGGTSLKLRYGEKATRVTKDLDTAWSIDLDSFLKAIGTKLEQGWCGFTGDIVVLKQATPRGIPFSADGLNMPQTFPVSPKAAVAHANREERELGRRLCRPKRHAPRPCDS